ncbi:MAG TPA: tRNA (adenosine(37)-N6)-threonylcarbamoyltransferase complex ATPase subunit type 1 TsaE [Steroidobacteraceae bacterium]|jgi:tRNA threonylcarbamoyladenosine biosynthesis protein TsaE|nr:tRNA (adenosine(37)-N6)-threonylcarbamoyltransferase complex ATPase subunit type 1 TsaE [Steroidobacteraceae bacterium]
MSSTPLAFALPDSAATETLGAGLARTFPVAADGAVVHLRGELGSGKTTCARSLLHALGVTATVRSPTYTLVDTYSAGNLTCVHVDLYRLQSIAEVEELGLRDLLGPGQLMLIEWPEKGGRAIPSPDLILQLQYASDARTAVLGSGTDLGLGWISKLAIDTSLASYVSNLT